MKTQNWYSKNDTYGHSQIADEDTGRTVAVAYDEKDGDLLASAPTLLAALKSAESLLCAIGNEARDGGGEIAYNAPYIPSILNKIVAAIAKAEGGAL